MLNLLLSPVVYFRGIFSIHHPADEQLLSKLSLSFAKSIYSRSPSSLLASSYNSDWGEVKTTQPFPASPSCNQKRISRSPRHQKRVRSFPSRQSSDVESPSLSSSPTATRFPRLSFSNRNKMGCGREKSFLGGSGGGEKAGAQ